MTKSEIQEHGRRIRVFSIPGKESKTQGIPQTCEGIEAAGAEIIGPKDSRIWKFGFDVIHLHFPAHYIVERSVPYSLLRSALSLPFYFLAKYLGRCVIAYEVHDVVPFRAENTWLLWPVLSVIHWLVDGFLFLSDSSRDEFFQRFPKQKSKPWVRFDHGSYVVDPADEPTRRKYRAELLGDDAPCFLIGYLGEIKDYKGLDTLTQLPTHLTDGTPVRLVIAGRIDPTYKHIADPLLASLGTGPIRIDRRIPDRELEIITQAVDVVLLPYTRGWNSGMAMSVLSAHTRILATDRPLFLEFDKALGAPWLYTFDGAAERRQASLSAALDRIQHETIDASDHARLDTYLAERSFERVGQAFVGLYRRLLNR